MSLEHFEARMAAAEGDHAALSELADELRTVNAPWAGRMRFLAIARRAKLKPAPVAPVQAANPLAYLELPTATRPGTPLYRFRLREQAFLALEAELKNTGHRLVSQPDRHDCAKFVVWAAEWFRRKFNGGIQRWADLGKPLGISLDHFSGRRLCKNGFDYWHLPLLRLEYSTEYLASIARQAGFPVAALDSGLGGWAQSYLLFIVGRMLGNGQDSFEDAIEHAIDGEGNVPQTWRGEELRVVCAELAVSVVQFRQYAERGGAGAGSLVSNWLDKNWPDWREELPISIDAKSVGFIDGLMAAKPLKGGGGSIRVSRELRIENGARSEHIALHLNGTLKQIEGWGGGASLSDEFSRLRLYAAGKLSDRLPGHLAIAEPVENGDWSARPSTTIASVEWPLSMPVEAELRGNDRRVGSVFCIPGGTAVGDGLRIWAATDEQVDGLPQCLQLAGTGSGSFRSEILWLDVPEGWQVGASDGGIEPVSVFDNDGRRIWKLIGNTHVHTPTGDIYSVRPGQKGEAKDQIRLVGEIPARLTTPDARTPLFLGWPQLFVSDKGKDRTGQATEIWWRPDGQTQWAQFGTGIPYGRTEFAWRDPVSGHLRAKSDAVILPFDFELVVERSADRIFVSTSSWGGTISLSGCRQDNQGRWIVPIDRPNKNSVQIKIVHPSYGAIEVEFVIPLRAWIGKWSGELCEKDSHIGMAELHHHLARTGHPTDLMADLLDRSGKLLSQGRAEWEINGELGLATLQEEISALIAPAGIDAKVKLNYNDGHENYWYVTQFSNELRREIGYGIVPKRAVIEEDVRVFGRFLGAPEKVRDFGPYGGYEAVGQRIDLPVLHGPWLIYLTKNGNALTRPFLLKGQDLSVTPETALGKVMIEETAVRETSLRKLVAECAGAPQSAEDLTILRSLVELAASLHDLPPSTFEIFTLLAKQPALMIELLFACQSSQEVERIMALEKGLSFSWACTPASTWKEAIDRLGAPLFETFMKIGKPPEEAALAAKDAVLEFLRPIADYEPALTAHFPSAAATAPITDIVESFLERSGDRIGKERLQNPFRPDFDPILRNWSGALYYRRAIDAPIVAAHAAKGHAELSDGQIACIKEIARRHPRYFSECYAAALQE